MPQVKTIDIDALTGRDLDAAVAEVVMGLKRVFSLDSNWIGNDGTVGQAVKEFKDLKEYSADERYVREVEAEIERRGLHYQYAAHLAMGFGIEAFGFTGKNFNNAAPLAGNLFALITATPTQRCRAALKAVMA